MSFFFYFFIYAAYNIYYIEGTRCGRRHARIGGEKTLEGGQDEF